MESFSLLKRRTTDLFHNVQQNLPAMPSRPAARKDTISGTWEPVDVDLPRSSHTLDIISGNAYVFGGEVNPQKPVGNDMHVITLPWSSAGADYYKIKASSDKPLDDVPLASPEEKAESKGKEPASPESLLDDVPAPRVGHATAVVGSRIFMFGGRGGPDMQPLEEGGRVWVFDTRDHAWSYLDPAPAIKGGAIVPHPAARTYHCATATDRPRDFAQPRPKQPETWQQWALGDTSKTGIPQAPIVGNVAEEAVDEETDGYGTFFIHAGLLSSGEPANDIWAFNIRDRTWSELPTAPGPARGGAAICINKTRLFRFGGYDGKEEIGGQLDFIHLEVETFDDQGTKGEVAIRARGGWQTILAENTESSPTEIHAEPEQEWPGPRSVASLEALTLGGGREYLVLTMGERLPGSDSPASGKYYDDVWMFQIPPLGMTVGSVTSAVWQAVGRKTGEGKWTKVDLAPYDDDNSDEMPEPRGWHASAVMGDLEENAILVWGGIGENNQRLGDGWILRLGS
ncbi:hypothetical protein BGZ63DRAFT_345124 [Mariannaea sp. PMI_226]|nr:hypothetical protein BGZ63DRAFT_345124 [Mariannaea sp. PMI_226]